MNEKSMLEPSMTELTNILTKKNPDQKYEFVPHVIAVDIRVANDLTPPITYQAAIDLLDAPDGFLLHRVALRHNCTSFRVRKGIKLYYSAPGWLHYINPDIFLHPALFFEGRSTGWWLDVTFNQHHNFTSEDVNQIQFALIGQRVVKL